MQEKYKDQLQIIATPTNEFIVCEKGTDDEVKNRYEERGVNFHVTMRDKVFLSDTCDLWKVIKGEDQNIGLPWHKFVIDQKGVLIAHLGGSY